jgi:hypothetical protein
LSASKAIDDISTVWVPSFPFSRLAYEGQPRSFILYGLLELKIFLKLASCPAQLLSLTNLAAVSLISRDVEFRGLPQPFENRGNGGRPSAMRLIKT